MTHKHWVMLFALVVVGCERKSEPPPPAGPATTSAAPAQPAASPAALGTVAPPTAGEVPTEEDYEEQAEREINASNLEAELDKLEREIGESGP